MNRYIDRERYFRELAGTSKEYYVDYLKTYKVLDANTRILEIGCGEGGNLLPFALAGCRTAGLDLAGNKVANARLFFEKSGAKGDFECANFLTESPFLNEGGFDIVLIHDVIEHIEPEYKELFFNRIREYLKPDGIVFFGFPAWQMPFGGHQQICKSKFFSKIPYVHLLPVFLYKPYLKMAGEPPRQIDELLSIKRSKMTVEKFEKLCDKTGYKIIDKTLWLISPHYKAKFNLTPRKLWQFIGGIPWLRNFFSTSCFYMISPK